MYEHWTRMFSVSGSRQQPFSHAIIIDSSGLQCYIILRDSGRHAVAKINRNFKASVLARS